LATRPVNALVGTGLVAAAVPGMDSDAVNADDATGDVLAKVPVTGDGPVSGAPRNSRNVAIV
jgi:flagellar biosynthesis/type III secretory pathway M-ring protein FliF/YscJ